MDVEATLRVLRTQARIVNMLAQIPDWTDQQRNDALEAGELLAEAFANLDDWLARGGFAPRDWRPSTLQVGERPGKT